MKIYVTNEACSRGIKVVNGVEPGRTEGSMRVVGGTWGWTWLKGEWFATPEEALIDAEKRRVARLASLSKQIEKLEKRVFKIKEG